MSGDRREFLGNAMATTGMLLLCQPSDSRGQGGHRIEKRGAFASAAVMSATASAFLDSLTPDQQAKVGFAIDDEARFDWHFIPRARKGLPFKELDPAQSHLANALLAAGLGQQGFIKASSIMSLEAILRETQNSPTPVRDPELYYFSIFGQPRSTRPWGWRIEGHHISLNYTLVDDGNIATTPSFLGSNPAEVRHGPRKGLRLQAREEDLARALLKALDDKQRAQAVVAGSAPSDIITGNSRKAEPVKPAGLSVSKLSTRQTDLLIGLLMEYASNMPPDIAAARIEKLRTAGIANTSFAWAGSAERGRPHYYRIQGPTFLVEYDNIQNDANHIHTVWRDFDGDFGLDLLAMHYRNSHSR